MTEDYYKDRKPSDGVVTVEEFRKILREARDDPRRIRITDPGRHPGGYRTIWYGPAEPLIKTTDTNGEPPKNNYPEVNREKLRQAAADFKESMTMNVPESMNIDKEALLETFKNAREESEEAKKRYDDLHQSTDRSSVVLAIIAIVLSIIAISLAVYGGAILQEAVAP